MSSEELKRAIFVRGVIIALLGAVLFSTKAIFVKLAYRDTSVDALTLLAWRMIFSAPFFIGAAFLSSRRESNTPFTVQQWIAIAIVGCLGYYVSSLLDFAGLQFVSAGIERLILFSYPTFALLMSAVLFRQSVKPLQWLALVMTYGGLALAFFHEVDTATSANANFVAGAIMIFICSITYAMYMVGSGRLIPQVGASKFNSYAMSFAALGVMTHFFVVSKSSLIGLPMSVYGYSFVMAIFATVVPSYLVAYSIRQIGSGNAAIISSIGPVSTLFLAYVFLAESITIWQLMGTAFILGGVLLIGKQKQD